MRDPARPRIDVHVHLSRWWQELEHTAYRREIDYSVGGLLAEMDRNRIGFALAIQLRHPPTPEEGLAEGRRSLAASGGRLLPVATVDPTKGPRAVAHAIRCWEREPLTAIKLFPGYRPFYPHDRRLGPVYEYAHRRGLPVMIHQGDTLDRRGLIKFARPIEVDEVAVAYPDVRFVLCHLGNPWIEEATELVYKNENVYADTSGLLAHPSAPHFRRMVERCRTLISGVIDTIGSVDRILYGSDWPLEELRVAAGLIEDLDLPAADREAILGGNARRLFGIPERPIAPPGGSYAKGGSGAGRSRSDRRTPTWTKRRSGGSSERRTTSRGGARPAGTPS